METYGKNQCSSAETKCTAQLGGSGSRVAGTHEIDQPAGRADDDVRPGAQGGLLKLQREPSDSHGRADVCVPPELHGSERASDAPVR